MQKVHMYLCLQQILHRNPLMLTGNAVAMGVAVIHLLLQSPGFVRTTKVNKPTSRASSFLLSPKQHNEVQSDHRFI